MKAMSVSAIREIVTEFGDREALVSTRYGEKFAAGLELTGNDAILTLTDYAGESVDAVFVHDVLDIQPPN